jgi:alanyl-tRNA synthetase
VGAVKEYESQLQQLEIIKKRNEQMVTKTAEIRTRFLDFFKNQHHTILPSSPLVPANDPTLMFTNAGMVQFKEIFTGQRQRPMTRAATVQKCIRISGKHNDLGNVGRTSRHHTFFEMLGNFSFGDYFKKEACRFAWALLTEGFGLDAEKLWVTVFEGDETIPADEEAARIWRDVVGVPEDRIIRLGAKENFWAMGDTGPCGPCSEVHFDRGEAFGPADIENSERFFEIWNLVFMQFNVAEPGGRMTPLAKPCIDTGAGLERIASVLQGVSSNYDIDVFEPLIEKTAKIAGKRYGASEKDDISMRVIADHARMAAHLIAEGVFPEKSGREYVLRRVMRRAIRHGHKLGIGDLFIHDVAGVVVDTMQEAYPELAERRDLITQICRQEEERFRTTLDRGLDLLANTAEWISGPNGEKMLHGKVAFDLTATYGFPKDLIGIIGEEDGFIVDEAGYQAAEAKHKDVSGAGKIGETAVLPIFNALIERHGNTEFLGYEVNQCEAEVIALVKDGVAVERAEKGEQIDILLDKTPFYGESGGQAGDRGTLSSSQGEIAINDTTRPVSGLFAHHGLVSEGSLSVGDAVTALIDVERRKHIRRHHTATHLLHMALRKVLGKHATQKGSAVDGERLRFDFAHFEPISQNQLEEIERLVAKKIAANIPVTTEETTFEEARSKGAMALFGEKYDSNVRMVSVSDESVELCGGTHVSRSGDIGACYVVAESGIAAGVRRIEAVAGMAALRWVQGERGLLDESAQRLKVGPEQVPRRLKAMMEREKELQKEIADLKRKVASGGTDLMARLKVVEGVQVIGARLDVGEPAALRETADTVRQRLGSGVVCLGGENKGKAALVVSVSKDLLPKVKAGDLVRQVAEVVGGRGGGRPDFAQAGGPDIEKLDDAVLRIYDAVEKALTL